MFHLSDNLKTTFKKIKRIGRGNGSHRGKNSGKGHKGQLKRAGKTPKFFEGGRKSIVRRTPKLAGFKRAERKNLAIVTLSAINKGYENGETVSMATLAEKKLINSKIKLVRVTKTGELTKKVVFAEEENLHLTKGVKEVIKA